VTKSDLVECLTRQSGMKKKEILYIIDNFIDKIIECTTKGDKVEIRGFGTFYQAEKKARMVFSPIAGKNIEVPHKTSIAFRPSKITKKELIKGA
jgi:nucleoid DNA-binding protein